MTAPGVGVNINGKVVANKFTLSSTTTLKSVSFYALDCCGFNWSGTISYYLFDTNTYQPTSTPFGEGIISSYIANRVYSDGATNTVTEYRFDLLTPTVLSAGSYWLGIKMSTPVGGDFSGWNTCYSCGGITTIATGSAPYSWNLSSGSGAFALYDTTSVQATPEPQSSWLLTPALGLMGIYLRRRKRA